MSLETDQAIYDARSLGIPKVGILGVQHMFAMFGATVLVPLITGLPIDTTLLMAGLGTLLFHVISGGKVPAFLGSSFAFLGGYSAVAPRLAQGASNVEMLPYACVGVAVAGLLYLVVAGLIKMFGIKKVMKFFPPIVTGPIIISIGLCLAPVAVEGCKANWLLALVALVTIIVCNLFGKGMVKIIPILVGILVSYVVAVFTKAVDFSPIADAAWIGLPVHKEFTVLNATDSSKILSAIIAIAPIALATIMEHIGDICAISSTIGKDLLKDPGLHRTLAGDGLATTMAALFGGPANTTYGENTGVLALTKVYDPLVIRVAAVLAVLLSFCPKFAAVIQTIPGAIVGGISFVLYGMISAVGIRNLVENHVDFSKPRNLIIAAVILVSALGGATIDFTVKSVAIKITPLAVASIAGILLNAVLPDSDYATRARDDEAPKGHTFNV
ncbi:MAG: uracil-xanthine permease family protein [Kiritimatiellia bacterium]|jgi:uracil permease